MHGVLWRWLLLLGTILWAALLAHDAWRRDVQHHPQYEPVQHVMHAHAPAARLEPTPPALTFWKLVSMLLSVSALIYIKRSSNMRKLGHDSLVLSYPKPDDMKMASSKIYNTVPIFKTVNYCSELKSPMLPNIYSNEPKRILQTGRNPLKPGIVEVELVQKKLENLEKSVASLRKRHMNNSSVICSTSGLVSGSPEFKQFLHRNMQPDTIPEAPSGSSQPPGGAHMDKTVSLASGAQHTLVPTWDSPSAPAATDQARRQSVNSSDSWTTISNDTSREYIESKQSSAECSAGRRSVDAPVIEEIMPSTGFSQGSEDMDECSLDSRAHHVPGSTLDSSSAGSSEDVTAECSTSRTLSLPGYFDSSTSSLDDDLEDDDVLLNTLD